jgi:phage portal protein BeeE
MAAPFVFVEEGGMGVGAAVRELWERVTGVEAAGERKTAVAPQSMLPYLSPYAGPGGVRMAVVPKANAVNLRRFAEMPVARRAINVIKDRVACMDWRIELRPDAVASGEAAERARSLRAALEAPNESDSFRTLVEQVLEDILVGGYGAVEIETTGDPASPVRLYPVDGASIEIAWDWAGDPAVARYAQRSNKPGAAGATPLRDDELMYVRLNPRTHTPFGLGKLEVAFDTVGQFLEAHRYAGRLASNSVVQYALWMSERTPEQHERLIRWWQDEVEGTGRVPVLSSAEKPEVLRFGAGTDADLRLAWQEFLLRMIANAFDLPPMLLGLQQDVNRSTASELADEAFQQAVVPVAKLLAEHITRDVILKRLGWSDLRFVWSDLDSRDELAEVEIQTKLLAAGVLSVDEVRAMRGLGSAEGPGPRVQGPES